MPLIVKDRVKETTTTTGTGTVTLAGAVAGYQSFSAIGDGNTTFYTITNNTQWEVGIGTYTSSGTTLARDTVLESSNSNNLVDFTAGAKDVFVTYPAEKSIADGYGTLPVANGGTGGTTQSAARTGLGLGTISTQDASSVAVTGGTITNVQLQRYRETVTTVTPSAGTATLDLGTANVFTVTLTDSTTALAFSNPPSSGVSFSITLIVKQDATGNRLLTYPVSCKFTDGVEPVLATAANRTDVITFFTVDGGTTFFGGQALANLS